MYSRYIEDTVSNFPGSWFRFSGFRRHHVPDSVFNVPGYWFRFSGFRRHHLGARCARGGIRRNLPDPLLHLPSATTCVSGNAFVFRTRLQCSFSSKKISGSS